jgi:hypothetical protein
VFMATIGDWKGGEVKACQGLFLVAYRKTG